MESQQYNKAQIAQILGVLTPEDAAELADLLLMTDRDGVASSSGDRILDDLNACIAARSNIPQEQARIALLVAAAESPARRAYLEWQHDHIAWYVKRASEAARVRRIHFASVVTEQQRQAELDKCADGIDGLLYWLRMYAWTLDPRMPILPVVPFYPFEFQERDLAWVHDLMLQQADGVFDKAREQGATWELLLHDFWCWLFTPNFQSLWSSKKEEAVDAKDAPDSLFEKLRFQVRRLPVWMLPKGFVMREHAPYMKLVNPENGSTIKGEAPTANFGASGRYTVIRKDEHALWPHGGYPQWTSSSQASRSKLSFSTPRGKFTKQGELRFSGTIAVHSSRWQDHPWKDERWYLGQTLSMTAEEIAQELDRDYEASQPGRIVPMFHEAFHFITEDEFRRGFEIKANEPLIPRAWKIGRSMDVGTSEDHPNITTYIARPSAAYKWTDSLFIPAIHYAKDGSSCFDIALGVKDSGGVLVYPGLKQIEAQYQLTGRSELSLISHEGESELRTYQRDVKEFPLFFTQVKAISNLGIAQMVNAFHLLPEPHPFVSHPATGLPLQGRPRIYIIVENECKVYLDAESQELKRKLTSDKGKLRAWQEIPAYHYPPSEKGKPVKARKPFRFFEDFMSTLRWLMSFWGPDIAPMTTDEKVEAALPAHLQVGAIAAIDDVESQSIALQGRMQQMAMERQRIEHEERQNSGMSIYELSRAG